MNNNIKTYHDSSELLQNYETLKKNNVTKPILSKYERCSIIGVRAEQLANNAKPLINVPKYMYKTIEIAELELEQKKTPFIVVRTINGKKEYWKIEDLS
jgi:DNA-directed RNA polymerase subunit K/omega